MGKIITCIDGSAYADGVSSLGAWVYERTGLAISLLHVIMPHSDMEAKTDITGQIGLGAKSSLLQELTKLDEEHGRIELKKGQLILQHAKEELASYGIMNPEVLHRRGSLVDIVTELEDQADLIIIGKRGEHHHTVSSHLGSNLERVARSIHKPILVATSEKRLITRFLIAYDGSVSANRAIEFAANNSLLKGLECHLLKVGEATPEAHEIMQYAEDKLKSAGMNVRVIFKSGKPVEGIVSEYIKVNNIDLLAIGAYGHSRIRCLILGSTTTALIRESEVPVMLFR